MNLSLFSILSLVATSDIPESVTPVVYIGLAIGFLAVSIGLVAVITDAKTERARLDTSRIALEKGQAVPPELLSPSGKAQTPRDDRRTGGILVAVAIGVFIFLTMFGLGNLAYAAAIPGCLGVAFLLLGKSSPTGDDSSAPRN